MTLWTGNMGDSFPALFRFAASRPGRRKAAQFFCPSVDDAEVDVAEPKEPVAIGRLGNADGLAGERLADEYEIAAPRHLISPVGRTRRTACSASYHGSSRRSGNGRVDGR